MKRYMKFIVAALGAAAYATQAAISDGDITGTEAGGIIAAGIIAVVVLLIPNAPKVEAPAAPK